MAELNEFEQQIEAERLKQPALQEITSTSKVSVWGQIKYVFAVICGFLVEKFERHKKEVAEIAKHIPWATADFYIDRALKFRFSAQALPAGKENHLSLMVNPDTFATEYEVPDGSLTASELEQYCTIKRAAVDLDGKLVKIKIATLEGEDLAPCDTAMVTALEEYLERIIRPGTPVKVITGDADKVKVKYTIYYDGTLAEAVVRERVVQAIQSYLKGIIYNGRFSSVHLTDVIQQVTGVTAPFFKDAYAWRADETMDETKHKVEYYKDAYTGYFSLEESTIDTDLIFRKNV